MHEYSIAYDLYATARKAAIENHADRVNKVCVDVGKMAMVNPDQVIFLFDAIREDDPLFDQTVLECKDVAPETKCSCGYKGNEIFVCPKCGALPELIKGREILVTNIEIEVDDA
ncbi:MAG: hydrogenase maturation nickel metallochaperone HypA [Methanoregula sp.]|nr:MAG: hydrogenase maturation nickel metallochaperone HypA [Methanoregula sp.]